MAELLILLVVFFVVSGFFAMVDAAFLSVTAAEVEESVMRNETGAAALKQVTRKLTRAVIVLVILTNGVNILGPILIGIQATKYFGSGALGIVTIVLTAGSILFSEIIPKALGTHHATRVSRTVAPALLVLLIILHPLVYVLDKLVHLFKRGKRKIGTEEQIRALVRIGSKAGHIEEDERQLIHRAFVLNDRSVSDIMIPRDKIMAIPLSMSVQGVAGVVSNKPHTRYPVYGSSLDDIRGFILSRDVLQAFAQGKQDMPVQELLQESLVVSGKMHADELLLLFRDRRVHLAIVKEGHRTKGIVTLKDVIEELVGEIIDEQQAQVS